MTREQLLFESIRRAKHLRRAISRFGESFKRIVVLVVLGVTLAACHQTDMGKRIGFPSPQERGGQR